MFFDIQRIYQNAPKKLPKFSQSVATWAQHGHLGANMAHLGRNLLPTWPILRPSWAHLRPNFAKNLHQIAPETSRSAPRHPKTTQRVAKGLQDSPWGSVFYGFGVDFGFNSFGFSSSLSLYFSWPPCLKFGTVAAWRAQRTGIVFDKTLFFIQKPYFSGLKPFSRAWSWKTSIDGFLCWKLIVFC